MNVFALHLLSSKKLALNFVGAATLKLTNETAHECLYENPTPPTIPFASTILNH